MMKYILCLFILFISGCVNKTDTIPDQTLDQISTTTTDQFSYGKQLMDEHKYIEAIEIFSYQITQTPMIASLYTYRAIAFSEIKRHDEAIKDISHAFQLSPNDNSILFLRGQLNYGAKNYKAALADFDSVQVRDTNFTSVWINKGYVYLKLGNKLEACKCFSIAVERGDDEAEVVKNKECE